MKVDVNFGFRVQLLDAQRFGFFSTVDFIKDRLEYPERLKYDCDLLAVIFSMVYKTSITGDDMYSMILRYKDSSEDLARICEVIDDTLDYFVRNMEVA